LSDNDKDFEPFQIKSETTLYDNLISQIELLNLTLEDEIIAKAIIGNIDYDGYLRRETHEIVNEINSVIAEQNFNIQKSQYEKLTSDPYFKNTKENPAKKFELSGHSIDLLIEAMEDVPDSKNNSTNQLKLKQIAHTKEP